MTWRSRDGPCPLVGDLEACGPGVVGPGPLHTHSGQVPGHNEAKRPQATLAKARQSRSLGLHRECGPGTKVTGHS